MGILNRLEMMGEWLRSDPLDFIVFLLYFCVCVLLTLVLHEIAHGYVAFRCGDPTAKMLGRLSLNPLHHLDPIGTLCLVFLGFGWAKPVPVNPANFRRGTRDDFLVSIAGITVNLSIYLLCSILMVALNGLLWKPETIAAFGARELLSSEGGEFNGAFYAAIVYGRQAFTDPAAYDAVTSMMRCPWLLYVQRFLMLLSTLNLSVGVFNLLPIPPLDGFHLVNDLLLKGRLSLNRKTFAIAQAALLLLCFTGALSGILRTVIGGIEGGVLSLLTMIAGQA